MKIPQKLFISLFFLIFLSTYQTFYLAFINSRSDKSFYINDFLNVGQIKFFTASNVCVFGNTDEMYLPATQQGSVPEQPILNTGKPLSLRYLNFNDKPHSVFKGKTFLINGWKKKQKDTNPAHWMMKLGIIYSLLNSKDGRNFLNNIDRIVFHQCANPFMSEWSWGIWIYHFITENWENHNSVEKLWVPDLHKENINNSYLCFKNCVFEKHYGIWIQKHDVLPWRRKILNFFNLSFLMVEDRTYKRIGVFWRKSGSGLRNFDNIAELLDLLKSYSPLVDIISVDENTPMKDQVKLFNSFDILITPHGSHLTNLIFTLSKVYIIEIISCLDDQIFRKNAEILGHNYIISTAHHPGKRCNEKGRKSFNSQILTHDHKSYFACSFTKPCDIVVNLTKIDEIFQIKWSLIKFV